MVNAINEEPIKYLKSPEFFASFTSNNSLVYLDPVLLNWHEPTKTGFNMFRSFSENQLLIGRAENILGRKVGSFDKNGDFEMDRQILTPEKPEKMADYTKVIKSDQPT